MINRTLQRIKNFTKHDHRYEHTLIYTLRTIITFILVLYILSIIDMNILLQTIKSAKTIFILFGILLYYPGQLFASYRWFFLLRRIGKHISFLSIARYHLFGQLSAILLPGQISGDLIKFISVSSKREGKVIFAYSILVDKITFLIAVVSFAMLGIFASGFVSEFKIIYYIALLILISSFGFLVILASFRYKSISRHAIFKKRDNRVINFFRNLLEAGMYIPKLNLLHVLILLVLSFCVQLINASGSYLIIRSLGITINLIDWAAINAIVAFVLILPITIAGIGVREGILIYILSMYHISASQTVAYSMLSLFLIVILMVIGIFTLARIDRFKHAMVEN
jgi:glycosyltransferase 2 family protein